MSAAIEEESWTEKSAMPGSPSCFLGHSTRCWLPLMAASRWVGSKAEAGADSESPWREFELPDLINRLIKGVLQLEISLTLSGLRFPVGGSRVIVAVKTSAAGHQLAG